MEVWMGGIQIHLSPGSMACDTAHSRDESEDSNIFPKYQQRPTYTVQVHIQLYIVNICMH